MFHFQKDCDFECCIQLLKHFVVKNYKKSVIIHLSSILFLNAIMIHVLAVSKGLSKTQILAFLAVMLYFLVTFYVQKTNKWVTIALMTCHSFCILHVVFLKT